MSIERVNNTDSGFGIGARLTTSTALGAVAGGLYTARTPRWIYKDAPSDTFIREVSTNLQKDLPAEEYVESAKISKFLQSVSDPTTSVESLKPMIRDSKELSEAIKLNDAETVDNAIERVFSQKDESKIKQDLMELQYKTKSDKKAGINAATKLIHQNFDAKAKKLVKSENTSEKVFEMIKTAATKVHAKTVATGALLTGLAAGALCLVSTNVPDENK